MVLVGIGVLLGAGLALAVALPITAGHLADSRSETELAQAQVAGLESDVTSLERRNDELQSTLDDIEAKEAEEAAAALNRILMLPTAVESCGNPAGITIEDAGLTMLFDHRGEDEDAGASIEDLSCIFSSLSMPTSVMTHMNQTSGFDGRQTDSWDVFEVQWSFHPDRGMDGMVTVDLE